MGNMTFEPITILGLAPVDAVGVIIVGGILILVIVLVVLYKQPPYRIRMVRDQNGDSTWVLENKDVWISLEWNEVCRDKDADSIKARARAALCAHYHLYEFIGADRGLDDG